LDGMTKPAKPDAERDEESVAVDEYAKFHELARKLVAVPKAEIDKARRKKTA
jgi:hypothetical protein